MPDANQSYQSLLTELREIALFGSVSSLLSWDEQIYMPPGGADLRADQSSLMARLQHERFTAPKLDELLSAVEASDLVKDPASDAAVVVRETRRDYDRSCKLPSSLVEELSRAEVHGQQAWSEAKKKSEFSAFRPWLDKLLGLKRQEAECVGYASGDPYDALLDEFEPGMTAGQVKQTFDALRPQLVELVAKIVQSPKKAPIHLLERKFPKSQQEQLARAAAAAVGFDFNAGRLDVSMHPFNCSVGPGDCRMTTRYDENYFGDAFFGVLHESGHALYEQGLPREPLGSPTCESTSLGIHESQSRLWENLVGRSKSFWTFFMPQAKAAFPDVLADVSLDDWHFGVNDVRPSLIRTEADEATYNLHIMIRFELERAMLRNELSTADLPGAWNEKYQSFLGITPPDDTRGCLQDIHWSGGAIGYFPTYTLGNLYAAQFFEQARKDLGDLDAMFVKGEFTPLLGWLRKHIHSQGRRYRAPELVQRVTGKPLTAEPLLRHLRAKASSLYGV